MEIMNWLKYILIALGLIFAGLLVFSVVGVIYHAIWYLVVIGVVAVGGYAGYQLFKKDGDLPQLEAKTPTAVSELKNADRALEEYKRKYLPK